jgi:uroporphyrinogen III methyltransferase/synthase
MRALPGTIYLVGAGPGDPGLLTVAASELLATCDVVFHDALVSDAVLAGVRPQSSICPVGKRGGAEGADQGTIERRLVAEAQAGRSVVRLKGGDPFVFGRGGEEALACARAGVPFVVVPGVSSAIAAPAYAGIPITHRGLARSVAVVTGTVESGEEIDWTGFRGVDTLVVLMAARRLAEATPAIMAAGWPPWTPAAVIESATLPGQRVVSGTLESVAAMAEREGIGTPAVLVVGDVVALASELAWFDRGPLSGATVVVTTTAARAGSQVGALRAAGANAEVIPSISIEFPPAEQLSSCLARDWDWIVLPSRNAVEALIRTLRALGRDGRALATTRLAVAGPGTAQELRGHGLVADFEPALSGASGIASTMPLAPGQRLLLLQSNIAPPDLEGALAGRGATVTRLEAYRTLPRSLTDSDLRQLSVAKAVTFASPSAVHAVRSSLEAAGANLDAAKLVAIGPTTAEALRASFGRCDGVAATPNADALVAAVSKALT